jgi:hypothetical protein
MPGFTHSWHSSSTSEVMGNSITIAPYALRIRETGTVNFLRLDTLPNGQSLLQLFADYLTLRSQTRAVNAASQHAFKALIQQSQNVASIDGIVQGGTFGYEAELVTCPRWLDQLLVES